MLVSLDDALLPRAPPPVAVRRCKYTRGCADAAFESVTAHPRTTAHRTFFDTAGQIKNGREFVFTYPIVAETFDFLNDANGEHVKAAHAFEALDQEIIYTLAITVLSHDFLDHGAWRKFFA